MFITKLGVTLLLYPRIDYASSSIIVLFLRAKNAMRKKRFILFSYAANVYSAARGQDQKFSSLLLSSKLPEMTKTASSKRYLPFNVNMRSASSATQVSCE